MTEKKVTRRRKKSTDTASVATPEPVEAIASDVPAESPAKAKAVEPTAPPKAIKPASSPKGVRTDERYVKVVAITNSSGSYGGSRFALEEGKTYSFPRELGSWLIRTGRAK